MRRVLVDIEREDVEFLGQAAGVEQLVDPIRRHHLRHHDEPPFGDRPREALGRGVRMSRVPLDPDTTPALLEEKPRIVLHARFDADFEECAGPCADATEDLGNHAVLAVLAVDLCVVPGKRERIRVTSILPGDPGQVPLQVGGAARHAWRGGRGGLRLRGERECFETRYIGGEGSKIRAQAAQFRNGMLLLLEMDADERADLAYHAFDILTAKPSTTTVRNLQPEWGSNGHPQVASCPGHQAFNVSAVRRYPQRWYRADGKRVGETITMLGYLRR